MKDNKEDIKHDLDELHTEAMACYAEADAGWREIRENALKDLSFCVDDTQLDDNLMRVARAKREPFVPVNRLPNFVKQVENELRQREMAITVHASDEIGSQETAEIFTSLIRGIEQNSRAKTHYIHAAGENGALVPGFGYIKVEVCYSGQDSFDQEVKITSVKDPFKILPDPNALEPDFSDANYWIEFDDYPEKVFKRMWPSAECASVDMFPTGAAKSDWVTGSSIRVARFWYREDTVVVRYLMDDGTMVMGSQVQSWGEDAEDDDSPFKMGDDGKSVLDKLGQKKVILRHRDIVSSKIKWCDFTAAEILDEGDWAGQYFPFAAVTGPMTIVNGRKDIRGIIRYAKSSQKMLNFMASSAVRRIMQANKSPWIVDMASIKPYEAMWKTSNTENWAFLPYNAFDPEREGQPNPPPQRADQTGQINDLLSAAVKFENDLKATIGIFDAGLGATPNEQSGVAIKTLAQQGMNSNYHFSDNLVRSLQQVGTILVDLIPKIYDTPRVVRVVGADTQAKVIRINEIFNEGNKQRYYNLNEGRYGVTVNVGPAFATQKQAAIEQMTELMRVNPNIAPFIQDIVARNMDYQGKDQVADRLTKLLALQNPAFIEGTPESEIPPEALGAMQKQSVMIQQLTEQLQQLQTEYQKLNFMLQSKTVDHAQQLELEKAKTENSMLIQQQKFEDEKQLEGVRALRDDQDNLREKELAMIKIQLQHTEKMMDLVTNAIKQFGPIGPAVADSVVDKTAELQSKLNNGVEPTNPSF